jgi:hypothetical protein
MSVEGLFRLSGDANIIARLRAEFDRGVNVAFADDMNPHDVAGVFKVRDRACRVVSVR